MDAELSTTNQTGKLLGSFVFLDVGNSGACGHSPIDGLDGVAGDVRA